MSLPYQYSARWETAFWPHRLLRWIPGEKGSEKWYRLFFGDYI